MLLPKDASGRARATQWLLAALNSIEPFVMNVALIDLFYKNEEWAKLRRPGSVEFVQKRLSGLFTAGALAVIRYAKIHGSKHRPWLTALLARRPTKVAAIALANKIARVAWAMMAKGKRYREPVALAA